MVYTHYEVWHVEYDKEQGCDAMKLYKRYLDKSLAIKCRNDLKKREVGSVKIYKVTVEECAV